MSEQNQNGNEPLFSENMEQTAPGSGNPTLLGILAGNYKTLNRIYGVAWMVFAILALLTLTFSSATLAFLAAFLPAAFIPFSVFSAFGAPAVALIVKFILKIVVLAYVLKAAKFADRKLILVIDFFLLLFMHASILTFAFWALALGSKVCAMYVYKKQDVAMQLQALMNEFNALAVKMGFKK